MRAKLAAAQFGYNIHPLGFVSRKPARLARQAYAGSLGGALPPPAAEGALRTCFFIVEQIVIKWLACRLFKIRADLPAVP